MENSDKESVFAAIYYDLGIYWWHLPFSEAKVHATSMYASSSQNPVFVCFRALMSIDQEEQKDNQFFVTTKFFKTGQMTICLQNLLFQNRELRAGADVFWATLSKNLIPRYSDKHYLKKDDEEEKKMSSHSASHGFHCNCVAQQSQLIKEVQLSPDFENGFLHIMYACNSMISSLTLHWTANLKKSVCHCVL
jgi:hypothetical protein